MSKEGLSPEQLALRKIALEWDREWLRAVRMAEFEGLLAPPLSSMIEAITGYGFTDEEALMVVRDILDYFEKEMEDAK